MLVGKADQVTTGHVEAGQVEVTVIICTRNRGAQLAKVLETACRLVVPQGLCWELLVVDNGSTDHTDAVIASYATALPIRRVVEAEPGLSNARNRGMAEARGDYLCWTDDDVLIDPNWLAAYVTAFRNHPEASIFGGRVIPRLEGPTPAWFARSKDRWPLTMVLAQRDFGDRMTPITLDGGRTPFGANYAVRTREQRRFPYKPGLGVSPVQKRIGEETDVIHRMLRHGGKGWWVPGSMVEHVIPKSRQTRKYVFDYSCLAGETWAFVQDNYPDDLFFLGKDNAALPRIILGHPVSIYTKIAIRVAKLFVTLGIGDTGRQLRYFWAAGFYIGAASYWRRSR